MAEHVKGKLLIIGGAEDKKGERKILKLFVQESGGRESRITVMTAATEYPRQVGVEYDALFLELGAREVQILDVSDRTQANAQGITKQFEQSTGVFFTGGDQLRITGLLGGTLLGQKLQQLYEQGIIIAGTSAGASVMSDTMIVEGEAGTARKDTIMMAPGLGLLRSVVIDQHFAQRGRIGRLLSAISQNPYVLGLGIDEDTAVLVQSDALFSVVGSNTVTVLDASPSIITNVSEMAPGQALVLSPITMHVLSHGYGFDLKRRVSLL
ncbi:MAG: cyanophycinase [Desulfosporosinus sp.]